MSNQKKPYQERVTYPLFFYPMFHPTRHMLSKDDVHSFYQALQEKCPRPTKDEIYIHIPFCDSFCHMCACYKTHTPRDQKIMYDYVRVIKMEMASYAQTPYVQSLDIRCVYFGGGTPTTLPAELIEELVSYTKECFNLKPQTEITYEGEVRTLKDKERLQALCNAGCNRVSFGVQTFDPTSRKLTGLVPTFQDIRECINNLREFGYKVNFDLMYGLPGQTFEAWKNDLSLAVELEADGLDLYETIIYPSTKLFRFRHKLEMADENQRLEMLKFAINYLQENGFTQKSRAVYEKPGNNFKLVSIGQEPHNTIAVGDNALGYLNHFAYRNYSPLPVYMNMSQEDMKLPIRLGFQLDQEDVFTKAMAILPKAIRIRKHIFKEEINYFRHILDSLEQKGLIEEDEEEIKLTDLGLLWTDNIIWDLVPPGQKRLAWKIMY